VHSDAAIACHPTIETEGDWDTPNIQQCAGAAIYRANVHKSPRNPAVVVLPANLDLVFGFGEFVEYHDQITREEHQARHRKDPLL
jgi:hypothetical protein